MEKGMFVSLATYLPGLLVQVFMMVLTVQGASPADDCIGWTEAFRCYACTTNSLDHYCGDPFNKTHPQLETIICKEYCVKWTRTTTSGKLYIQRTCSSELQITLRKTTVCIHESRPSNGSLCFCKEDSCNGGQTVSTSYLTCFSLLALMHILHALLNHTWYGFLVPTRLV